MNENLFTIIETNSEIKLTKDEILNSYNAKNIENSSKSDNELEAKKLDFHINYTSVQLSNILDYYKISSRKLKKADKIDEIINYENDEKNILNVSNRKKLWFYVSELTKDEYFKKKIYIDL
jgi:hypothetical protein